jgi:hypothetical protein
MQKILLFFLLCLPTIIYAEESTVETSFETLKFKNSKKKDNAKRYSLQIGHISQQHYYQFFYEKTDTNTFKPPLTEDLHVHKYAFKYTYLFNKKEHFEVSYQTIDDNLMKETDGGHIYGIGYGYHAFHITQYISDYPHFNVYQTDLTYQIKNNLLHQMHTKVMLIAKYIHLQDKESNNFSKNAKDHYLSPGVKLHMHRYGYHFGGAIFFGKRVFAIMNNGLSVQHHAMEFDQTAMFGVSKDIGRVRIKLKYVYQQAEEIPIHNDNVKVANIALSLRYSF